MKRLLIFFIIVIITIIFPLYIFSQQKNYSKEKYIEDFDYLQKTINNYYLALPLVEERTNVLINKDLNDLRLSISDSTTLSDFIKIVYSCLTTLNDSHTGFASKNQIISGTNQNYYLSEASDIQLSDTINVDFFNSIITDEFYANFQCWLWTKYDNGKYYVVQKFDINDQIVEIGDEITHINNIPINEFVNQNRLTMYHKLWDNKNKQWYDESFLFGAYKNGINQYELIVGGKKIELDAHRGLNILSSLPIKQNTAPQIHRLKKNILYIYLPMMSSTEWYINELKSQYTTDIEKIILDVRGNPGGSDNVWQMLLSHIIKNPMEYMYYNAFREDERLIESVQSFGEITVKNKVAHVKKRRIILPDSNSVQFDGKIYVVQNKFTGSAASALSSVAMQLESIELVGEPSAYISGYTFPALLFKLPNTGLVYNLAFSIDKSGGKENPYMDKVEKFIPVTFQDFLERIFKYDIHGTDYLNNYDKTIQSIIND